MPKPRISKLHSGGMITNYLCSSSCRHCLYRSSPKWERFYMNPTVAWQQIEKVQSMGCNSLHIGGGEPFLNPETLREIITQFQGKGIHLEYVETNSSWYTNDSSAIKTLKLLKTAGLRTILLSISPFHNEFIPFGKVKRVADICVSLNIQVFHWIQEFLYDLNQLGDEEKHSLEEFSETFGEEYVPDLPARYHLTMKGRALETYRPSMESLPLEEILKQNPGYCGELFDTSHFHVDLYGNYVPGLCPGLAIRTGDLGDTLREEKYPCITTLMTHGIGGFYEFARSYRFEPREYYVSKCDLCEHIRSYLVESEEVFPELKPDGFYRER